MLGVPSPEASPPEAAGIPDTRAWPVGAPALTIDVTLAGSARGRRGNAPCTIHASVSRARENWPRAGRGAPEPVGWSGPRGSPWRVGSWY